MRTIPSYLVALLAISVIFGELGSGDFFRYAAYVQNFILAIQRAGLFPGGVELVGRGVVLRGFSTVPAAVCQAHQRHGSMVSSTPARRCSLSPASLLRLSTRIRQIGVLRCVGSWVIRIDSIAYGFLLYLVLQRRSGSNGVLRLGTLALLILAAATVALIKVNDEMLANDAVLWLRHVHPFCVSRVRRKCRRWCFFFSLNSFVPKAPGGERLARIWARIS
jgi:hypothetical protein